MLLIKLNKNNINFAHHLININDDNFMILDYNLNTRYNSSEKYIPQYFNNYIVFISAKSFQQTHYILSKQIRKYVIEYLNYNDILCIYNDILCIGGESYLYTLNLNLNITFYTNNQSIYDDCIFNNNIYKKHINYNLVDYNKFIINSEYDICLINLSYLNTNIINQIQNINKIIIISCHHDDFWKKINFPNHKLIIRKKFICYKMKYFITVNIFIKKIEIVSLGGNCSVAYHLNQYGYRFNSYPFDWCNIKLNQLINVFKNDFKDFEKLKINKLSHNHLLFSNNLQPSFILTNNYGCKFAHEVIDDNMSFDEFKNKLIKRIFKFKTLKNPVFIRLETSNDINNYNILIQKLDKYFDNYKFILISKINPNNSKIIHYKLDNIFNDWKYNNLNWKNIFINIYIYINVRTISKKYNK